MLQRKITAQSIGEESVTPPASTEPAQRYRDDIDGLRALAILSVILYHSGLAGLTGGFTGVDIFFVISGYLIGGRIWTDLRAGSFSFLDFYRRRARRILPAFYAVSVFCLVAGLLTLSPGELARLARDTLAAALSVSNFVFWWSANYFTAHSELNPLLMTWSLGVEEQFYAVIPLLMVAVARFRREWVPPAIAITAAASLVLACAVSARYPMAAFYLLPARAWELGAGIALAVFESSRVRSPFRQHSLPVRMREAGACLALLLMALSVFLLDGQERLPGLTPLPSVAGAVLIIALPGSFVSRRLLSAPPLRFLGRISYSWYLWHWPLLSFLHNLYGGAVPAGKAAEALALSLLLAVVSFYVVEQPFRRSRRAPVPLLIRYAVASGILLAVCAALWIGGGLARRAPSLARMENAARRLESDPCLAGLAGDTPNLAAPCYDRAAAEPLVALWGDSHAAALAPGMRAVAQAQGYGLALFAKAACPPLSGATHAVPRLPTLAAGCTSFNRQALAVLENDRRVRIVVLEATWDAPFHRDWQDGWLIADGAAEAGPPTDEAVRGLFVSSLRDAVSALVQAGKQVVVFLDSPAFDIDPAWRVKTQALAGRRLTAQWLGVADAADPGLAQANSEPRIGEASELVRTAAAGFDRVEVADLRSALCIPSGQCIYRQGDTMLYVDSSHLSTAGALYALRDFHFRPPAMLPAP